MGGVRSLYLVNAQPRFAGYDAAEGFVSVPDLAIVTIAGMAPDHWDVRVCEEELTAVDLDHPAQFVGLTGKTAQLPRMIELAAAFRARGKTVLAGGPLATLDPDALRPHVDILVTGEIEEIASSLFAGLDHLFVGIETVNEASLRETRKRQNLLLPAREAVERIVSRGILVRNGIMIGFDHDGPDIFDTLFDFLQESPLPVPTVHTVFASKGTPLRARIEREGRLIEGEQRWEEGIFSNIVPKLMSHDALIDGTRALSWRLFTADAFDRRMMNFIAVFGNAPDAPRPASRGRSAAGPRGAYAMRCLRLLRDRGREEAATVSRVLAAATANPACLTSVITCLVFYEQYRAYLDDQSRRHAQAA